jgi:hypothetical protein
LVEEPAEDESLFAVPDDASEEPFEVLAAAVLADLASDRLSVR